jgi:eukaryotic-like serine/threonine-protein kinase
MKNGFLWCPHCRQPHKLGERYCARTGKSLDQRVHNSASRRAITPPQHLKKIRALNDHHRLVGTIVDGKFEIRRHIGGGGMGQVYEASNRWLDRDVALKVVTGRTPEAGDRLRREAKVIASLQHPNICDVYDVGVMPPPDGRPYLVLERLIGETLHTYLARERRLSPALAVDVFTQILCGLQHAHAVGIIHRDIKPANVFLVERSAERQSAPSFPPPGKNRAPLVKLLDFGLAKDVSTTHVDTLTTKPGRMIGTPEYMSPEQLFARSVDARSDLFSVGIMLFLALTNRHPFGGESPTDTAANILREPHADLRQLKPRLPDELTAVIHRALEKNPANRFHSALDMLLALSSINVEDIEPGSADSQSLPRIAMSDSTSPWSG